ncbi:hypothetical protein [Plebeiibacterium sediminum]|uniref:Uncharacterized protein n=1 Tax=Plebeiibacterium sediminum TaxID=2992112 RepID=A0AAE3MB68_9BACT|nr:hypothetical protein [Plebeiobacterium sediminum]MCW3789835.1 hypothetical protein [Plebeiobacterium sediminum]
MKRPCGVYCTGAIESLVYCPSGAYVQDTVQGGLFMDQEQYLGLDKKSDYFAVK